MNIEIFPCLGTSDNDVYLPICCTLGPYWLEIIRTNTMWDKPCSQAARIKDLSAESLI
jgi:hypothetical protein